jgi:hypothetical protein
METNTGRAFFNAGLFTLSAVLTYFVGTALLLK